MRTDRVGALLREVFAETADCPPPESYLEESLNEQPSEERERLLLHARRCPRCSSEMDLAQAFSDAPAAAAPGSDAAAVVERLERLRYGAPAARPVARLLRVWGLPAAAMLALAVVGVALLEREGAPPLPPPGDDTLTRGERVEIVGPAGEVGDLPRAFEWVASPGAASYRVRLLRVDDSILLETTVETPRLELPARTLNDMHRAVVYFWQVEALDERGARTAISDRVRFRAAPG